MSECPWSFIINPSAGARSGQRTARLVDSIRERFPDAECLPTGQPGDALAWARARRDDAGRVVVAVGGDGTVNSVACGLAGGCTRMAVIPAGSGNDFARMLGMPRRFAGALDVLADCKPLPVDFARVRVVDARGVNIQSGFVNSLGLGLEARIAARAGRARWLRGFPRYLAAALAELLTDRPAAMVIEQAGQRIDQRQVLVALANGRWAGGGFMLAPAARLDSGELVLTRADPLPLWRLLMLLPTTLWGGHVGKTGVHQASVRNLRVDCPDGVAVHLDGEVVTETAVHLDVAVQPGALKVLAPGR